MQQESKCNGGVVISKKQVHSTSKALIAKDKGKKTSPKAPLTETQKRNIGINRMTFLVSGLLFTFLGMFAFPFLFLGIILLVLSYCANKKYKETPIECDNDKKQMSSSIITEPFDVTIPTQVIESKQVSQEQFSKMRNMCVDIYNEYKALLKRYKEASVDDKVYILKESYRKLEVIQTTTNKYNCYDEIDIFDEIEKVERKARSFINSYIKEERDSGLDDYMIDVIQFSLDLDFIADYIYEKNEKLNK